MKALKDLIKFNMIIFVVLCGMAGYGLGFRVEKNWNWVHVFLSCLGLAVITAGSFALNQAQEHITDAKMPRTQKRPIPSGRMSHKTAWIYGLLFTLIGFLILYFIQPMAAYLGMATVIMYNVLYTLHWKRHMVFGAVPGAIPGAMPVVIGYSAIEPKFWTVECFYLFMIMFLWQMPHFWSLAIKYKDDYQKAGFPVLPVKRGVKTTLYHMGLYTFAYVGLAVVSPWFVSTQYLYLFLVLPFCLIVLVEFFRFAQKGEAYWLRFFLWINFSMLAFVFAPVIDKWTTLWFKT